MSKPKKSTCEDNTSETSAFVSEADLQEMTVFQIRRCLKQACKDDIPRLKKAMELEKSGCRRDNVLEAFEIRIGVLEGKDVAALG